MNKRNDRTNKLEEKTKKIHRKRSTKQPTTTTTTWITKRYGGSTIKILLFAILQANINVVVKLRTIVFVLHRIFFIYFLMEVWLTCKIFKQKIFNVWQLSHSLPSRTPFHPPVAVCHTLPPSLLPDPNTSRLIFFTAIFILYASDGAYLPSRQFLLRILNLTKIYTHYMTYTYIQHYTHKLEKRKRERNMLITICFLLQEIFEMALVNFTKAFNLKLQWIQCKFICRVWHKFDFIQEMKRKNKQFVDNSFLKIYDSASTHTHTLKNLFYEWKKTGK